MDDLTFALQRIKDIRDCDAFGPKKVNLLYDGGGTEGIWVVPVTADDDRKMRDDDCAGVKIRVYLVNMPVGWCDRCWGAEIIATTMGSGRPVAHATDQTGLDDDAKHLLRGLKIDATRKIQ